MPEPSWLSETGRHNHWRVVGGASGDAGVGAGKNALVKQYQELLRLDDVELTFDHSALGAAADLALKRGTGARGLRSIIESRLLDVMFEIPGRDDIRRVVIDAEVINATSRPHLYGEDGTQMNWAEDGTVNPAA